VRKKVIRGAHIEFDQATVDCEKAGRSPLRSASSRELEVSQDYCNVRTGSRERMSGVLRKHGHFFCAGLLLIAAALTYGTRYWTPDSLFWDENYHIASAQKQIHGVMYMETHPPLGKMLIALGEVAVGANAGLDKSQLLSRDHISNGNLPKGFSYAGVRLASVLAMILSVLFLYGVIHAITRQPLVALAFASLAVFDNALVVHTRSAMLEGIQIFFVMATLYFVVRVISRNKPIRVWQHALLGGLIGLVVAIKLNGAVLLILPVVLFAVDQWDNIRQAKWLPVLKRLLLAVSAALVPLLVVVLGVFYVHIASGTQIASNRTYKASTEYLAHIRAGTTWTPGGFVAGLQDHLRYMSEYSDGVPRLDPCKPGENGSHASGWPIGARTINYRWNKDTIDGKVQVSYLYLIGNPMVWLPVLLGIVLSIALAISRYVYGNEERDRPLFRWIMLFTALYVFYMLAILQIERVMYLYHYLLPLVFGIINLALIHTYIFSDAGRILRRHAFVNLSVFILLVAGVFAFFAPLTYGIPLTVEQFELRDWFAVWKLEAVR
jgi:dolichyl-phosphate-mannose--protein O-mannosyl transferase